MCIREPSSLTGNKVLKPHGCGFMALQVNRAIELSSETDGTLVIGKSLSSLYVAHFLREKSRRSLHCEFCNAFSPLKSKIAYVLRSKVGQILRDMSFTGIADTKSWTRCRICPDVSDLPLNEMPGVVTYYYDKPALLLSLWTEWTGAKRSNQNSIPNCNFSPVQ